MLKTVKIGDSVVGQIAVGLGLSACDAGDFLNPNHVAWYHDAHLDP